MKNTIRNTYISLLNINLNDKITVIDICNATKISRVTFYRNFSDISDLLTYTQEAFIEEFICMLEKPKRTKINNVQNFFLFSSINYLKKLDREEFSQLLYENTLVALLFFEKNRTYLFALKNAPHYNYFRKTLKRKYQQLCINSLPSNLFIKLSKPFIHTYLNFFTNGIFVTIEEWIFDSQPLSVELFAEKLVQIYLKQIHIIN